MSEKPIIACDLTRISEEEQEEHQKNAEGVLASVQHSKELADGYALQLPAEQESIERAASFIALERLCCPFLHFRLEIESNHGPVWLKLTGAEGVKAYLKNNLIKMIQSKPDSNSEL